MRQDAGHRAPGFSFRITAPLGFADIVDDSPTSVALTGLGSVVYGDPASRAVDTVSGGLGFSTVVLGDGNCKILLTGAFNTVVLGDGNNFVNLGGAQATVKLGWNGLQVCYGGRFSAFFQTPNPLRLLENRDCGDIGVFNGGKGNIGAFNGLGNASATSGNGNIGVFNGLGNGGQWDGNDNIGAFNGNLNGLWESSPTDGANCGNGNVGAFNGNFNGNFVTGVNSGDSNGNGNLGFLNGDSNGNGQKPSDPLAAYLTSEPCATLVGGFDTAVLGNGNDAVRAMAGLSTIKAGNGNDRFVIGGMFDTVAAGDGADVVIAQNVTFAQITLGNGADRVILSGCGNKIVTGSGSDYISVRGDDNLIDAGAPLGRTKILLAGQDNVVELHSGSGLYEIFGFTQASHDELNVSALMPTTPWGRWAAEYGGYFTSVNTAAGDVLEVKGSNGHFTAVAELMGVHESFAELSRSLIS